MTHDDIIKNILQNLDDSQTHISYNIPAPYPKGYTLHIQRDVCPNVLTLTKGDNMVARYEAHPTCSIDMEVCLENLLNAMSDHWGADDLELLTAELDVVPEEEGVTLVSFLDLRAGLPKDLIRHALTYPHAYPGRV